MRSSNWMQTECRLSPEVAADLVDFRERLLRLRAELESIAETSDASAEVVELDQAKVGRLSRMDAMQAQAMAQASGHRRDRMQLQITAALARIENDDFGYCRACEEAIPVKRLEFDPTVTRCVDCASAAES
jgi:DnaK suppressor protein